MAGERDIMLGRMIRALMAYFGPVIVVQATIEESDRVIAEMAENGQIREAKKIAAIMGNVREAVGGDKKEVVNLEAPHGPRCGCHYCT